MHEPSIFQGHEHRLTISGEVHVHLHVHFDHAALSAKLREATSDSGRGSKTGGNEAAAIT